MHGPVQLAIPKGSETSIHCDAVHVEIHVETATSGIGVEWNGDTTQARHHSGFIPAMRRLLGMLLAAGSRDNVGGHCGK